MSLAVICAACDEATDDQSEKELSSPGADRYLMKFELENMSFDYTESGSGRAILMLHGGRLDHHHMKNVMEPLFESRPGWRRIYVDYPGHGDSPDCASIQSIEDVLSLLVAFINETIPGERFVIAGMSRGGYLARGLLHYFASRVDGVFFDVPAITTAGDESHLPARTILSRQENFEQGLSQREIRVANALLVNQNAETLSQLQNIYLPAITRSSATHHQRIMANYDFSFDIDTVPGTFDRPVLFLLGRQDDSVGYHDMWQILDQFPRATFAVLDKAGHLVEVEQPHLFRALVGEWMDRVEAFGDACHENANAYQSSLSEHGNAD